MKKTRLIIVLITILIGFRFSEGQVPPKSTKTGTMKVRKTKTSPQPVKIRKYFKATNNSDFQ